MSHSLCGRRILLLASAVCFCYLQLPAQQPAAGETTATVSMSGAAATEERPAWMNAALPVAGRVRSLVSSLTAEEIRQQLAAVSPALPKVGIPAFDWRFAPAASPGRTIFPGQPALASTWNVEMAQRVGLALAEEEQGCASMDAVRADGPAAATRPVPGPVLTVLDDPRRPDAARAYGEDPHLVAQMACATLAGIAKANVREPVLIAAPVFGCPAQPATAKDMTETLLVPVLECLRQTNTRVLRLEASPAGLQGCQTILDAIRTSHDDVVTVLARADCHTCFSPGAGTDDTTSMSQALPVDVNCMPGSLTTPGGLTPAEAELALQRRMAVRCEAKEFDPPDAEGLSPIPGHVIGCQPHRRLALQAARESIILLKNDRQVLPLKSSIPTIAVIGPAADTPVLPCGTAGCSTRHSVTVLEAIMRKVDTRTRGLYAAGCVPALDSGMQVVPPEALKGLSAEYIAGHGEQGDAITHTREQAVDRCWPSQPAAQSRWSAIRWTGGLMPHTTGECRIGLHVRGRARVSVDGKTLLDVESGNTPCTSFTVTTMEQGRPHPVVVEYYRPEVGGQIQLLWSAPDRTERLRQEAVEAAKSADVSVVCLGTPRPGTAHDPGGAPIGLPQEQTALLEAVCAVGKPVVVVLVGQNPVSEPLADERAAAVVMAMAAGEEAGTAVADVLFGDSNPAGRLPVTIHRSQDQLPPIDGADMTHGRTYRYFGGQPLYPFGHGLSYSSFAYSDLKLSDRSVNTSQGLTVRARVRNTSRVAGDEVAQLYVAHPNTKDAQRSFPVPIWELQGFQRIHLQSGETKDIEFELEPRQFAVVNLGGQRVVEPGQVQVSVGGGQPAFARRFNATSGRPVTGQFTVTGEPQVLP